jgi:hypothetical protein
MPAFFRSLLLIITVGAIPNVTLAQKQAKVDYGPKCECHFGYGGNACVIALACGQEGGRCAKSCVIPPDDQSVH